MKKKIGIICLGALLLAGCGTPKLENGKEAVVTFKDDAKISVDDLYEKLKNDFALDTLVSMVDTYIMEKEFPDYIQTAKTSAENSIKAFIQNYESEEQALQVVQQYLGYATLDAYQNYLYLNYMKNHAIEEYSKILVTDKDIEKYYKDSAKGDVEISHILITVDTESDATDDEKTKAENDAKAKAEDIIKNLKKAKDLNASFKEMVKENSKDEATIDKDGALGKLNYLSFPDGSYDELLDAAYKIKDGEVYEKAVKTADGYHVIMKTKSYEKDTLENLKDKIKDYLAEDLRTNSNDIEIKTDQYYRDNYKLNITDNELKRQYDNYMKRVLASVNSDTETEE